MKSILILALTSIFAMPAFADGFVCGTLDREVQIQIYHHTLASDGTRKVAAIIFSDPSAPYGQRTIAALDGANEGLNNYGANYHADFSSQDSQAADPQASSTYLQSIPLSDIQSLDITVFFSYSDPVAAGTVLKGTLAVTTVEGKVQQEELSCVRYLKQ